MSNIETVEDLFKNTKHNPSYSQLHKSLKANHAITDYCIPVNSYFPTPMMMEKLMNKIPEALKYYPDSGENMAKELSPFVGVPAENLVLSNGSTELITWIDHLLIKENIAVTVPTFGRWTDQPFETGKKLNLYHHQERNLFHLDLDDYANFILKTKSRVAVICNPNNPTGNINSREEIIQFIEKLPQLDLIVIDESFIDFSFKENIPTLAFDAAKYHNVIVLKSLGKNLGLHGIRAGLAISNEQLAKKLRGSLPHWNINGIVQNLIILLNEYKIDYELSRKKVIEDRDYLYQKLQMINGIKVYPTHANFVFVQFPAEIDGKSLRLELLYEFGYLTRECGNKIGSSCQFFRIGVRPRHESDQLVKAICSLVNSECKKLVG